MKLTKNAKIFAITGVISSAIFFPLLDWLLARAERRGLVLLMAVVYGLIWFLSGLLLGKADQARNYRGDLGLLYHAIMAVIVAVASILAAIFLKNFGMMDAYWGIGVAGLGLLGHWLGVRNSVKGIDKKTAFK